MTEQQPYELLRRYADFELRRYPAHTVAEVEVSASFDRAGNAAFRHLFNYISGSNTARRSLAMTAPVVQEAAARRPPSQKVAMTAPVLQSGLLDAGTVDGRAGGEGAYLIEFVLPADMTEESAPVPADPRVRIRTVPASTAAVLRFSGRGSGAAFSKRGHELRQAMAAAGLQPRDRPGSPGSTRPSSPSSCAATRSCRTWRAPRRRRSARAGRSPREVPQGCPPRCPRPQDRCPPSRQR